MPWTRVSRPECWVFPKKCSCCLHRTWRSSSGTFYQRPLTHRGHDRATGAYSLLSGIKCRIATLKKQLQSEHCPSWEVIAGCPNLKPLRALPADEDAPSIMLTQCNFSTSIKGSRGRWRPCGGSVSLPVPTMTLFISHFQELIRGTDITAFALPETGHPCRPAWLGSKRPGRQAVPWMSVATSAWRIFCARQCRA